MKIKFAGLQIDDKITVRQLCDKLGTEGFVTTIEREPTAQELTDATV
jgi:hypothetical protein